MSDSLAPHRRFLRYTRCALLLGPWLAQLLIADIALSALLPVSVVLPDLCYDVSSRIAEAIWRGIQRIFTRSNGADIVVSGAENLPQGESAIVVSNHVEWTDFYMIQELAGRVGMLGRCRWFAKQQLRWVPFLGWGLWAMGMPLVSRKWTSDQKEMDRVFKGVLQRQWPMWLIAYSEATRYTASKRLQAEAWCRTNNRSLGLHLLYPRTKGFIACVQKLRQTPSMKAVYDITVAYAKDDKVFQQPPKFVESVLTASLSEKWRFFVHVDRHPLETLPQTEEGLAQWLEDRWVEKGDRLETLNQKLQKGLPWSVD
ncbi:Acyltransferase C-terminus [Teratosphaeria destructans]|uniref:Acyltransferase C-terminus n=1 Tax=Teratosphaeria destructans TaxID=418781 RepID=A0A9W7W7B2_9PEZI|nr:Acyltransferase C-terminus [Teratosphaeria destructans]